MANKIKSGVLNSIRLDYLSMAVGVIALALLCVQGARWYRLGHKEGPADKALLAKLPAPPARDDAKPVKDFDDAVSKHGMLGTPPPEPPGPPPVKLWGIMGESALFGATPDDAQPYRAGDQLSNGSKIIEVRVSEVLLEKDGKQLTEKMNWEDMPAQAPSKGKGGRPSGMPEGAMPGGMPPGMTMPEGAMPGGMPPGVVIQGAMPVRTPKSKRASAAEAAAPAAEPVPPPNQPPDDE